MSNFTVGTVAAPSQKGVRLPTSGRDAELGARLAERLHCRVLQRDFVAAKVAPF
jgi:hypothetical protein